MELLRCAAAGGEWGRLGRAWCSRSSSNSSRSSRSGSCSSFFHFFRVDILSHCHVAASRFCLSYLAASGVTSLLAICEHTLSLLLLILVLLSLLLLVLVLLLLLSLLLLLLLLLVVRCFSLLFVSKWCHVAACHLSASGVTFYHDPFWNGFISKWAHVAA